MYVYIGFPGVSDGKESACNVRTQVRSLGWEDALEMGSTDGSTLAWRIHMGRGACQATVHGITKSQTQMQLSDLHIHTHIYIHSHIIIL